MFRLVVVVVVVVIVIVITAAVATEGVMVFEPDDCDEHGGVDGQEGDEEGQGNRAEKIRKVLEAGAHLLHYTI